MITNKIHPAANIFPPLTGTAYEALKADIDKNGQREAIVYQNGKLLDGRNRKRICGELGIRASECEIDPDIDPVAYVISVNLHRRYLKISQRAMCAAKLAGLKNGQHGKATQNCGALPVEEAAKLFDVSPRSVTDALKVLREGWPELVGRCEEGEIPVSQAVETISLQKKIEKVGQSAKRKSKRDNVTIGPDDTADNTTAPVCPNCGSTTFDSDGDCTKCKEPDVGPKAKNGKPKGSKLKEVKEWNAAVESASRQITTFCRERFEELQAIDVSHKLSACLLSSLKEQSKMLVTTLRHTKITLES